ncbi:Os01g0855700, partial [Oryza sativa Japonica Group]
KIQGPAASIRHYFRRSASPGRSRVTVTGHPPYPVVGQERLGGVEAGEVGRLEEHLRQGVHLLRRREQRAVGRRLRGAHHRRHELPVREEEPPHRRLHGLERLQQLHLAGLLALAAPPAVEQPHGCLLHPRPAVGVHLDAKHTWHTLLEVPRGVSDVQQRPGAEAGGRVGARCRPYCELALEPQEVVRVHQQVQVLDVGEQLPDAFQDPAVARRGLPVSCFDPVV